MTPQDPIDSAINNAAARMTGAKPSDALRANVMSRLRAERFGGQARLRAWRFVFAGGAIASVALVAFASWPGNSAMPNPSISNPTLINPTVINSQTHPTAGIRTSSPVTSVNAARIERAAVFTPSEAEMEWSANAPPALERPDPLKKAETLELKLIDNITPLGIAPLVVPALGDDGSNR